MEPIAAKGRPHEGNQRDGDVLLERQKLNFVLYLVRRENFADQFQVANRLPYGELQLVGIDDAAKSLTRPLSSPPDGQKVFVASEHNAAKFGRAL